MRVNLKNKLIQKLIYKEICKATKPCLSLKKQYLNNLKYYHKNHAGCLRILHLSDIKRKQLLSTDVWSLKTN